MNALPPHGIEPPDDNPKTALGIKKPPFAAIPPVAIVLLGQAMRVGEERYGLMNWREKTVSSSVYYNAMLRHLFAWWDGEDRAADSNLHHLAHVMACCSILLDAASLAKLNDDRPIKGLAGAVIDAFSNAPPSPAPLPSPKSVVNTTGWRQPTPLPADTPGIPLR